MNKRAVEENSSDDEFFTKREKSANDVDDFNEFVEKNMNEEKKERVQSYLETTPDDQKERFLHDYIVNMKWKEKDDDFIPQYGIWRIEWLNRYKDIVGDEEEKEDLEEDIKDLDQQDRFEHLYNTRFEQENIITYPR